MTFLQPNEYDISFFDGGKSNLTHNAGYHYYTRWPRINNDFVSHEESQGEFYRDLAFYLTKTFDLKGKGILDVGCAKGFVVKDLRDFGVEAYGVDISQYAVDSSEEKVKPYLTCADARTYLKNYQDLEFDFLFTRWVLDYIPFNDLSSLVSEMNRISRQQVHIVWEDFLPEFCNKFSISEWVNQFDFKDGT